MLSQITAGMPQGVKRRTGRAGTPIPRGGAAGCDGWSGGWRSAGFPALRRERFLALFVGRWADHRRHRDIVEPEIQTELRAMVYQMVQHKAANHRGFR